MQIWKHYQTNKYYRIDPSTGKQSECDSTGKLKPQFNHFETGFKRNISLGNQRYALSVQPSNFKTEKFNGYAQYPRPIILPSLNGKTAQKALTARSVPPDNKITMPLEWMKLNTIKRLKPRSNDSANHIREENYNELSLEELRNTSKLSQEKILKTSQQMIKKLKVEKEQINGFHPPSVKQKRRELKGSLNVSYRDQAQLQRKEAQLIFMANPQLQQRVKERERLDYKHLQKRKQQQLLQAKLLLKS